MGLMNALVSSTLGFWRGTHIRDEALSRTRSADLQPLQLYDMEGCPFCRLVREALTELDLDVVIYPCPKGGERFRSRVLELGGKEQFPFMVDPNTGRSMYESKDIVEYLFRQYGRGEVPGIWRFFSLNKVSAVAASAVRLGAGAFVRPSKRPDLMLELYAFESSPYAKPVRERLSELEIPYLLHNIGKSGAADYLLPGLRRRYYPRYAPETRNRKRLREETGQVMAPHLVDPNTGQRLYESQDICRYLDKHYRI